MKQAEAKIRARDKAKEEAEELIREAERKKAAEIKAN